MLSSSQTTSLTFSNSQTPSITSITSDSTSGAAQPESQPSTSHRDTVALSAGLGVPLGMLLLTGMTWLLYREKRSRKLLEQKIRDMQASFQTQWSFGNMDQMGRHQPSELHGFDRPPELHSRPLGELGERRWSCWSDHSLLIRSRRKCWR